jgi:hypothetical protein
LDICAGRDEDIDLKIHLPGSPEGSGVVLNHVTAPGFLMAFLWGLQLISIVFLFEEPERINGADGETENNADSIKEIGMTKYGTVEDAESRKNPKDSVLHDIRTSLSVILSNMAFPVSFMSSDVFVCQLQLVSSTIRYFMQVTLYLFAFIELSGEVLISSCSMIVRRYFSWHGSRAGFIIASLGALVLPAHFIVERASRFYSERQIMKYSIVCKFDECFVLQ